MKSLERYEDDKYLQKMENILMGNDAHLQFLTYPEFKKHQDYRLGKKYEEHLPEAELYREKIMLHNQNLRFPNDKNEQLKAAAKFLKNDSEFQDRIKHLGSTAKTVLIYDIANAYADEFVKDALNRNKKISKYRSVKREVQDLKESIVRQRESIDRIIKGKTGQNIPEVRDLIQKFSDFR